MDNELYAEILDILENDANTETKDIAKMLGLQESEVKNAIKQMEDERIIIKYAAIVNREKTNIDTTEALIEVKVTPQRDLGYDDVAKRIYRFNEVKSVYLMSGTFDLSVLVEAQTMKQISTFVFEKLAILDGVRSTVTHFIMRKYKEHGVVLIEEEQDERLVISP